MGITKSLRRALTNAGFSIFQGKTEFDSDEEMMMAVLHPDAHPEGGLACNDAKLLAEMRECIMQWIRSMGRQLLQGNLNLVNSSFPVLMFEPRSYLQKLADIWAYPDLINRAAAQRDPLERMKLLVTWMVAGLHHSVECWKKPFNPILGETWQATMAGGLSLYMEQVSHHPPVSAYQLEGPGWQLSGWSQPAVVPVVKFYGIKTVAKGSRHIRFDADDSCVEMSMPHFAIKGVVYATKPHAEVLGVARLLDEKNRLEAIVNFGPVPGTRQRMLARADAVCGEIYKLPKAAHLHVSAAGGAIQRSSTSAVPLNDLSSDTDQQQLSLASEASSSCDDGAAADPDDEAIFEEFNAQHFGGTAAAAAVLPANGHSAPAAAGGSSSSRRPQRQPAELHRSKSNSTLQQSSHCARDGAKSAAGMVPGVAVARIEGSWLSHLNIDNTRFWTLSDLTRSHFEVPQQPLPSDLSCRQDLASLASGDLDGAQHWKEVLELQQRTDRKLREAAGVFEGSH